MNPLVKTSQPPEECGNKRRAVGAMRYLRRPRPLLLIASRLSEIAAIAGRATTADVLASKFDLFAEIPIVISATRSNGFDPGVYARISIELP